MKKNFLLLLFIFECSFFASAQQLSPSVIASAGDISGSMFTTIERTLGEFAVESVSSGNQFYTQGFHQPVLIAKEFFSPTKNELVAGYKITAFPNPVLSVLQVRIESSTEEKIFLSVIDLNGKMIFTQSANSIAGFIRVNMASVAQGMYVVKIRKANGQLLKMFK